MEKQNPHEVVQQVLTHIESLSPGQLVQELKILEESLDRDASLLMLYLHRILKMENACKKYIESSACDPVVKKLQGFIHSDEASESAVKFDQKTEAKELVNSFIH